MWLHGLILPLFQWHRKCNYECICALYYMCIMHYYANFHELCKLPTIPLGYFNLMDFLALFSLCCTHTLCGQPFCTLCLYIHRRDLQYNHTCFQAPPLYILNLFPIFTSLLLRFRFILCAILLFVSMCYDQVWSWEGTRLTVYSNDCFFFLWLWGCWGWGGMRIFR